MSRMFSNLSNRNFDSCLKKRHLLLQITQMPREGGQQEKDLVYLVGCCRLFQQFSDIMDIIISLHLIIVKFSIFWICLQGLSEWL